MPLSPALVMALASHCAPAVAPETLVSVVRVESAFDPLAIGVNRPAAERLHPRSLPDAIATATRLIADGANIDIGLGQINIKNLVALRLTVAGAFDPCRNLAASAQLLAADYDLAGPRPGAEQAALRTSFSLYNTGDALRGFRNGYVAKVVEAAGRIVPALQPGQHTSAASLPPSKPAWDVFARPAGQSAAFVFTPAVPGDAP
jgi:type IV secretion system protein VirB1